MTSEGNSISRRSILKRTVGMVGGSSVIIVGTAGDVSATKIDKELIEELYDATKERYGRKEATITTSIFRRNLRESRREGWSKEKTSKNIQDDIIDHPNTPQGSNAIRVVRQKEREHQSQLSETADVSSTKEPSLTQLDLPKSVPLGGTRTDKNASFNCRVEADVTPSFSESSDSRAYALANASVFGNGYGQAQLYFNTVPTADRTYEFTCRYRRRGTVFNADADLSIFVKSAVKGKRLHKIDDLTASGNKVVTRTTDFDLDKGRSYEIGVELYTTADAAGAAASYADYYNSTGNGRRQVEVQDFAFEKL